MSFRIQPWPTFFTAVGLAILVSLGTWQLNRFFDARDFEQIRDARIDEPVAAVETPDALTDGTYDFRRIEVEGIWDRERLFLINHRVYDGSPGYWVVIPLRLTTDSDSTTTLLVNRGWIPRRDGPQNALDFLNELPSKPIVVSGLVHVLDDVVTDDDFHDAFDASDAFTGVIPLESYDTDAMNRTLRALDAAPIDRPVVVTESPDPDRPAGHPESSYDHVTQPYLTAETHFGYMLTWYLLAIALIAIWIAHGLGRLQSKTFDSTRAEG